MKLQQYIVKCMPRENTAQALLNTVTTVEDRNNLLDEIERIEVELSKTQPFSHQDIQQSYPLMCEILKHSGEKLSSKIDQDFNNTLSAVKQELKELNEVTVHTPVLTGESLKKLKSFLIEWVRSKIDSKAIVSLHPTADVVAGLAFSYKGEYRDLTIDNFIQDKP